LTLERPKPLVPLLGRPLAAYALDRLALAGVRSVVANTFHLGEQVQPTLAPFASALGMSLASVQETVLLGTGGGIRNALPLLGRDPFVVFNGDVLAAPEIARALELHVRSGARTTMVLREDPSADKLGAIEVDGDGRVRRILGEGAAAVEPVRKCMFTGVYVLSPDVREDLPENGCIVRHSIRRWLARGDRVSAIVDDGPWFDLGTIAEYARVTFGLLDGSIAFPGQRAREGACAVDRATATVGEGVTLGRHVVVSEGAKLSGHGSIDHAIVWNDATLEAPASNVIATTNGARVAIG
jgi:NDP-sugar pyrophosphorylase family protein